MKCEEFLEGYSAYLDGLVEPGAREEFEEHVEACESCARYDRVVRRGLLVARNLPRVSPSSDFLPRLQNRLRRVGDRMPSAPDPGSSAALVAVAAVGILALAWLPFAVRAPVEVELPAMSVEGPPPAERERTSSLFGSGPFVAPTAALESSAARRAKAESAGFGEGDALRGTGTEPTDSFLEAASRRLHHPAILAGARPAGSRSH